MKGKGTSGGHNERPVPSHQHIQLHREENMVQPTSPEPSDVSSTPRPLPFPSMVQKGLNLQDTKALQMAAITRALSCMKRFSEPAAGKAEN